MAASHVGVARGLDTDLKPSVHKVTPILNVSDVPASVEWFRSLGWESTFCWNDGGMLAPGQTRNQHGPAGFAGVCSREAEIFLSKDGQGSRPDLATNVSYETAGGVWMSWWLDSPADVDAMHALAVSLGHTILRSPRTEPWRVREFHLRHPDGHVFRVGSGIE
jgi:hypothetical protein